jgi:nucleotide-binding universal stress UspA family protein
MNGQLDRTIVVGVDGSPDAARALEWAIDEAKRRGMKVLLVHGVEVGAVAASPYGGGSVLEQLEDSGRVLLGEAMEAVKAAGLPVDCRMEIGSGAHALIEASRGAELLVVGSRGHGGFVGMLLGSVSNACTHHAHCPVVVIRPEPH